MQKLPLPVRFPPPFNNGLLCPQESASKRHLDRFSRFCTAHPCD